MVCRRNPNPPQAWRPTPEEWLVYTLCDGRRTEEAIVWESGLGEEAYRILARLIRLGLVEPVEGVAELRPRLEELFRQKLGPRAGPLVERLKEAGTREDLEATALRLALKVKLTLDQKAGEELEKAIRNLFG